MIILKELSKTCYLTRIEIFCYFLSLHLCKLYDFECMDVILYGVEITLWIYNKHY
jgi:hypothetical protein